MNKSSKQVAVWLDHTQAHVFEFHNGESVLIETVDSPYDSKPRIEGEGKDTTRFGPTTFSNNEDRKHNRLQNELKAYYTELEGKLKSYDEILLFGPSTAKDQLYNRLMENKIFTEKTIAVESVGALTDNQTLAYVRDYYKALS